MRGVTTVYTTETPTFVGPNVEALLTGVSALVENLIFMRFVELDAKLHRLVSVLKVRDTGYDSHVYEFQITKHGIDLAHTFASAENVLTGFASRTASGDQRARPKSGKRDHDKVRTRRR